MRQNDYTTPTGRRRSGLVFVLSGVLVLVLLAALAATIGCGAGKNEVSDLGFKVYVPNPADGTITVVPATQSQDTTIITLDGNPQYIALVPGSSTVFALLSGGNQIDLIDSSTDEVSQVVTFDIGTGTAQINNRLIFSNNGQKAYVSSNSEQAGVAVMKVSDLTLQTPINVQSTSVDLFFFSSDGTQLYCTDSTLGKIYAINAVSDDLIETLIVPESFSTALYNPATGHFFMAESGTQATVKEFDPATLTFVNRIDKTVDNIVKLVFSPDGTKLFAVGSDQVAEINLADFTIATTFALDFRSPTDFQFLPDSSLILVPSSSASLIMLLDPTEFNTKDTIDTVTAPGEIIIFD
jgi:DNA-binding beta-propeller fold protein YncE